VQRGLRLAMKVAQNSLPSPDDRALPSGRSFPLKSDLRCLSSTKTFEQSGPPKRGITVISIIRFWSGGGSFYITNEDFMLWVFFLVPRQL
jgi:hypothetical protein